MSVESISLVLNHSRAVGTDKVVLLGIANHDGDGGSWPAIATLARYANVHERSVRRSIAGLVRMGELRVHLQEGGTLRTPDWHRPNRYEILVAPAVAGVETCPRPPDVDVPRPVASAPPPDAHVPPPPDAHVRDPLTPTSAKPSFNHPDEPSLKTPRAGAGATPAPAATQTALEGTLVEDAHDRATHAVDEAERLAHHLASRVHANGGLYTKPTRADIRAIAGLFAKGATTGQVEAVIDWATTDDFWRRRIDSATNFAAKFTKLALGARAAAEQSQTEPAWAANNRRIREAWAQYAIQQETQALRGATP